MRWVNFFHIYQPPHWSSNVIAKVAHEAYRPLVRFLLRHRDVRLTLNVSGSLTEQLRTNGYRDVLRGLRVLNDRGQIELTDSAMYHAILPLLPTHEVVRQVALNHRVNRRAFGPRYRPRGFFPPEMAYSPTLGRTIDRLGYDWTVLDGVSHGGLLDYTVRSRLRGLPLVAVFRNRYISDYLAFRIQQRDVRSFLPTVRRWNAQTDVLVTGMDGENLGHHRHAARRIWQTLVRLPTVRTMTMSELIDSLDREEVVTVRTASWSSQANELRRGIPFGLWRHPGNALHRLEWRLFDDVHRLVHAAERRGQVAPRLRREFDRTVSSDWYWWSSRMPWWDVDIIVAAAMRLRTIAEQLDPPRRTRDRIAREATAIIDVARRWQASGAAKRFAKRFMRNEQTPRYLGGKSVL